MNLKNKLEAERQDEPLILLYMEGIFWKAYEQSAMRFAKEVKAYKLQKRFIKTVNREVVSMGFPNSSLQEVLKGWEFVRMNDKQRLVLLNLKNGNLRFLWKAKLFPRFWKFPPLEKQGGLFLKPNVRCCPNYWLSGLKRLLHCSV